jgi:predicted DNA binding CopG/RHH family protein
MSHAKQWIDPFDDMSDDEFDAHVDALFAKRLPTVGVSLRVAPDLLERVKRQAAQAGVPYQTFIKSVLEAAVARLEGHTPARTATRLTAKLTAKPADVGGRRRTSVESKSPRSIRGGRRRTSTDTRPST